MKCAKNNCFASKLLYADAPLTSLIGEISDSNMFAASITVFESTDFPIRYSFVLNKYLGIAATPPTEKCA